MRLRTYLLFSMALAAFFPVLAHAETALEVPYTSQAPQGNWKEPWQNACEETSILMIDAFYKGYSLDTTTAPRGILSVLDIKNNNYGTSLDENARKMMSIINNFFPWESEMVENPSLDDIKREIDAGHPVIMPVYGKGLRNPSFTAGGPVYHVFVISGYDDSTQEFITQEPGINRGKNYRYSYATIMESMHDFLPDNKTAEGPKRALFTRDTLSKTALYDPDSDGLTKEDEIKHGTALHLQDTDGDGFRDGDEVKQGFSPIINESKLLETGGLIKSAADPKVYSLKEHEKHHILNEEAFLTHGFKWRDIITVSDRFIDSIPNGEQMR